MSHVPVFNNVLNLKHACVCGRLHTVDESLTSSLPALGQAPPTFFFFTGLPFQISLFVSVLPYFLSWFFFSLSGGDFYGRRLFARTLRFSVVCL